MHFFSKTRIAALILLSMSPGACAIAQTSDADPPALPSSPSQTADSLDLRKNQLRELLEAIGASDTKKSKPYLDSLAIPNHQEWFIRVFGPTEGPRLELAYSEMGSQQITLFSQRVLGLLRAGVHSFDVKVWKTSQDAPTELLRVAFATMVVPVPIYELRTDANTADKIMWNLGYLVSVDDEFRYLDPEIFRALSNAPARPLPSRITVAGNIQAQHLVSKIEPVWPEEAKKKHIAGVVLLHVVIAKDGSVKSVEPVRGDPLLVQAAVDAVKQWRYKPTLLNGVPVEVDTAVEVPVGKMR